MRGEKNETQQIKYLEIMKRHENLLQCNDKDIINKVKFELGMCD